MSAAPTLSLPLDLPEVPADSQPSEAATRTPAEHQATLDRMAYAASTVLCDRLGVDPILVRAHAAQDRFTRSDGDRAATAIATYVPADDQSGLVLPCVDVALGGELAMTAERVAAAVALGAVFTAHPGRAKDAVKRQIRALHGLTDAPRAPSAPRLSDVMAQKRPDTSALARAVRAAKAAQGTDPDPIGGAALPGLRQGKRFTLPSVESGQPYVLRGARKIAELGWTGKECELILRNTGTKETFILALGPLTHEKA